MNAYPGPCPEQYWGLSSIATRALTDLRGKTVTAQSSQGWGEGSIGGVVRAEMGAVGTHRREGVAGGV